MKKSRKQLKPQSKPINPLDRAIGGRLRVFRLRRKLSQAVLGHAVGVTFQQIQKYENGRNRLSGSRLVAFCRLLGCSSEELLDTKSNGVSEDQFGALRDRRTSNLFIALSKLNPLQRGAVISAATEIIRGFGGAL